MPKPRDYCCCAIPVVNAGIYTTLLEQFTLGVLIGTLAMVTPSIVGVAAPSVAKLILAVVGFVGAAIQIMGLIGVVAERPGVYRSYTHLHYFVTLVGFSVSAAWIIISLTKNKQAMLKCQSDFFTPTSIEAEKKTLCEIFVWVDIGILGFFWILFAGIQSYLCFVVSCYGTGQRIDHESYDSFNDRVKSLRNSKA